MTFGAPIFTSSRRRTLYPKEGRLYFYGFLREDRGFGCMCAPLTTQRENTGRRDLFYHRDQRREVNSRTLIPLLHETLNRYCAAGRTVVHTRILDV